MEKSGKNNFKRDIFSMSYIVYSIAVFLHEIFH